jgi:hypothetical protein
MILGRQPVSVALGLPTIGSYTIEPADGGPANRGSGQNFNNRRN